MSPLVSVPLLQMQFFLNDTLSVRAGFLFIQSSIHKFLFNHCVLVLDSGLEWKEEGESLTILSQERALAMDLRQCIRFLLNEKQNKIRELMGEFGHLEINDYSTKMVSNQSSSQFECN